MIDTLYIFGVVAAIYTVLNIRLIQNYSKTKDKTTLYFAITVFLCLLTIVFAISEGPATSANNLPLATRFYQASITSFLLSYIFINMYAIAITNTDRKYGIWLSVTAFLIITFIIWAFNPIVEAVVNGIPEFTLTSTYKEPYGLPLIEIAVASMIAMVAYPIYLFFRIAKDSKERIIRVKSFLIGIGLFIIATVYPIEVLDPISYTYELTYRPIILVGAFIFSFGYVMPKWLEGKIAGSASAIEKPASSPLQQFFLQQVAPRARSQMGAFSKTLGLNHKQMAGRKILLEFNPTSNYEKPIQDFVTEAVANAEQIVIFTRRGSSIHSSLREYEAAKFFCFTQQFSIPKESSENEILLPSGDTSLILDVLDKALKMKPEGAVNVIFDNLSDLLLSIGFDKTYRFIRYVVEMLASPQNTVLFLINQSAHEPNVMASLKGLFSDQLTCGEKGVQVIKLHNVYQTY
jgi:hypothetical protein